MARATGCTDAEIEESVERVRARLFGVQFQNASNPNNPLTIYPPSAVAPSDYRAALLKCAGSAEFEKLREADRLLRFRMLNEFERGGMSEDQAAVAVICQVLAQRNGTSPAPPARE